MAIKVNTINITEGILFNSCFEIGWTFPAYCTRPVTIYRNSLGGLKGIDTYASFIRNGQRDIQVFSVQDDAALITVNEGDTMGPLTLCINYDRTPFNPPGDRQLTIEFTIDTDCQGRSLNNTTLRSQALQVYTVDVNLFDPIEVQIEVVQEITPNNPGLLIGHARGGIAGSSDVNPTGYRWFWEDPLGNKIGGTVNDRTITQLVPGRYKLTAQNA